MPSDRTIQRELARLRAYVESNPDDAIARRVACEVECAIRWATERTVGWPKPLESAVGMAAMIRRETGA